MYERKFPVWSAYYHICTLKDYKKMLSWWQWHSTVFKYFALLYHRENVQKTCVKRIFVRTTVTCLITISLFFTLKPFLHMFLHNNMYIYTSMYLQARYTLSLKLVEKKTCVSLLAPEQYGIFIIILTWFFFHFIIFLLSQHLRTTSSSH